MSYLHDPRLSFGGRFLSDVSTRNNIDRNYQVGAPQRNLWNVSGGASFELLDCGILQGDQYPRRPDNRPDPVSSFVVTGAIDRSSAKMVDLDPDWQMASEIWAMKLRVTNRFSRSLVFEGELALCSFRDLWMRQVIDRSNGQAAGGRFVSVLSDIEWGPEADESPAAMALRDTTQNNKLSVGLHTFGYYYTQDHPRYRTGACMLHLGPYFEDEAQTALVHRRIESYIDRGAEDVQVGNGAMDFVVDDAGTSVHFDVGHALLLGGPNGDVAPVSLLGGNFTQVRRLSLGLLPQDEPDLGDTVPVDRVQRFFDLPEDPRWYETTGGVVTATVPQPMAEIIQNTRLCLFAERDDDSFQVVAKETTDAVFYRAEHFVRRLDPGQSTEVKVVARQFGRPLSGLELKTGLNPPGGPGLTIGPVAPTDAKGETVIPLAGSDPGTPRAANDLDGQIFAVFYSDRVTPTGSPDRRGTGLGGLDVIPVHVREPFPVPDRPEFHRDIQPFMAQYAQLYPIMSEHLFDIADYDALVANRTAMLLAFRRDVSDPNYMPVTRDMSQGRIDTLIKWLENETGDVSEPLVRGVVVAGATSLGTAPPPEEEEHQDAKAQAANLAATPDVEV